MYEESVEVDDDGYCVVAMGCVRGIGRVRVRVALAEAVVAEGCREGEPVLLMRGGEMVDHAGPGCAGEGEAVKEDDEGRGV